MCIHNIVSFRHVSFVSLSYVSFGSKIDYVINTYPEIMNTSTYNFEFWIMKPSFNNKILVEMSTSNVDVRYK